MEIIMDVEVQEMTLSRACIKNDLESAKEVFDENKNIDVLQQEGSFFYHAIDNNSTEMFNTLLDYYVETKLTGDDNSIPYKYARSKLIETFHELQESIAFPLVFRAILNKHDISIEYEIYDLEEEEEGLSVKKENTNTKDASDPEQDLSGFEEMLNWSEEKQESITLSGSETSSEGDH